MITLSPLIVSSIALLILLLLLELGLLILAHERKRQLTEKLSESLAKQQLLEIALTLKGEEFNDIQQQHIRLQTQQEEQKQHYDDRLLWLDQARAQLLDSFNTLSQQALQQSQQSFLSLAEGRFQLLQHQQVQTFESKEKQVHQLLEPIRLGLQQLETERNQERHQWHQAYGTLHELVKHQGETTHALHKETQTLTQALKSSHVRGVWGEVQLARVIELSGMTEHCDYELQSTLEACADTGSRKRPDLIVKLPGSRYLAVDAKAPLKAYLEALEAQGPEQQKAKLQEHAHQLRQHVQQLSQRRYWTSLDGFDLVVLFIPGDIFLQHALSEMPDLFEWALERHVLLATPTSLIALLKTCSYSWHHSKLEGQLAQIIDAGKELYSRLQRFGSHMEELRKGLEKSARSYNELVGSWQSRVLTSAKRLHEIDPSSAPPHLSPLDIDLRGITSLERESGEKIES